MKPVVLAQPKEGTLTLSIHHGSFSLSRYKVIGRSKSLSIADLNENLASCKLKPFQLKKSLDEISYGWDAPWGWNEQNFGHWDMSDCRLDDGYWLRVRVEKRKLPSQLLQLVVQEMEQEILSTSEEQTASVGRKKRKELVEKARQDLMAKSLPSISFFELFWKDETDTVYLFTTSKANRAIFEELFRKSFGKPLGLSLVHVTPPLLGLSADHWRLETKDKRIAQLEATLPASIETPG